MSAFICNDDHFKALAIFAATRTAGGWTVDPRYVKGLTHPQAAERGLENFCDFELATLYANVLRAENIRSVEHRYRYEEGERLVRIKVSDREMYLPALKPGPVAVLKMCDCLDYQSCETDDWEATVAYRLLAGIRSAAIRALPGYNAAPWEFRRA